MSKHITGAVRAQGGMTNSQCRARRLAEEREALALRFQAFVIEIPELLHVDVRDLNHLAGYKILEPEGLVHAGVLRPAGRVTIIAATSRFLHKPELRQRLFALRRLAQLEFKRVVIATPRGLLLETARLRKRRRNGLVVAPPLLESSR